MVAYIATEENITIILNGKHKVVSVKSKNHRNDVIKALEKFKKSRQTKQDILALETFLTPIKRIRLESDNRFELDESQNHLYMTGSTVPVEPGLASKILDFIDNGLPVDALVKFWESCLRNPHFVAVQELFQFLDRNELPITEDGGFLGYKKLNLIGLGSIPADFEELFVDKQGQVRNINGEDVPSQLRLEYLSFINNTNNPVMVDVHSGTIKQKLGEVVQIDRVKFNEEERRLACGYGLHIGSYGYAFSGSVRVLCKVMPEDVIACNPHEQKLRTCKYQIISFVDSNKEVKQLLVDLSKECKIDVEEESEFEEGETVRAVRDGFNTTQGDYYYITRVDGNLLYIIDDKGVESTYYESFFEKV